MVKKGKKDFQIRGVFPLNPKKDPACKAIESKHQHVSIEEYCHEGQAEKEEQLGLIAKKHDQKVIID